MITKDGRDTPIEKLTSENYVVPNGEERSYHAVIEVVQFDQKTGKRISKPRVQKFGKKQFETSVLNSLRKQGYTITILHNPNEWIKEQREKAEKAKAEQEAAKAKAEQERFEAAVAAEVKRKLSAKQADNKAKAEMEAEKAEQETTEAAEAEQQPKKPGRPAKQ